MPILHSGRFFGLPPTGGSSGGGGGSDPDFASVVLLIGAEGADGSTAFDDESNSNHTITVFGNAQIDTAQFKYGASSALFDGAGDYISMPSSANWDLSDANSDEYTIEFWIRWAVVAANERIMFRGFGVGNLGWAVRTDGTNGQNISFLSSNNSLSYNVNFTTTGGGMTTNTWYHIAIDKDSTGKIRIYIDGVMRGSNTPADSAMANPSHALTIGADQAAGSPISGWMDEIRITKGVARYASDGGFTPPAAEFPRS